MRPFLDQHYARLGEVEAKDTSRLNGQAPLSNLY